MENLKDIMPPNKQAKTKKIKFFQKKEEYLFFGMIIAISLTLASGVDTSNGNQILELLATLIGILFSGILASLSIIISLLSSKELYLIKSKKNGDQKYHNFIENAKFDIKIVFYSMVVIFTALIISKTTISDSLLSLILNKPLISLNTKTQILVFISYMALILSLSSIKDLIMAIFSLGKFRYDSSEDINKNNFNENSDLRKDA